MDDHAPANDDASCVGSRTDEPDAVHVGDRMRFSTALLQQIHKEPEHRSVMVIVERIVREDDGCLLLHLRRAVT